MYPFPYHFGMHLITLFQKTTTNNRTTNMLENIININNRTSTLSKKVLLLQIF